MKIRHLLVSMVIILGVALIVTMIREGQDESGRVGPNPDGSYGTDADSSLVQVAGTMTEGEELTIFLRVDVGSGGKYLTHIVLPIDGTIREAKKDVEG